MHLLFFCCPDVVHGGVVGAIIAVFGGGVGRLRRDCLKGTDCREPPFFLSITAAVGINKAQ